MRLMYRHIEEKVADFTRADICQGYASDAVIFEDLELATSQDPETDVVGTEEESEEDTSIESRASKAAQLQAPPTPRQLVTSQPSPLPALKRGASGQSQHADSPRHHSSVAESLLSLKKSGKPLTRYSKSLRS